MAEQLPITGYVSETTLSRLHTYKGDIWPSLNEAAITALTPHAPAQSALDELRREVEALRAELKRSEVRPFPFEIVVDPTIPSDEVRFMQDGKRVATITGIAAIDTARASTDEGVASDPYLQTR